MVHRITDVLEDRKFVTKAKYDAAIRPCRELAINRNERYGNSVALMDDASVIDLVMMKLYRTKQLTKSAERAELPTYLADAMKRDDEIKDAINYLVYLLMRRIK